MQTLRSFVQGEWVAGEEPGSTLYNAVTGEPIATASTRGIDRGAALAYGRQVGGASLRAMTFAERGAMLGKMAEVIHGARDELIDIARINSGNTRKDAKFDIDGASGTLAFYARLGANMGDRTFALDGDALRITRSKRFLGQHIWVPRRGVAIHINAFNFPAWNMAEKAAAALLAGVPVLTKPATSTAALSARIVELWTEAGVMPEGALQFLCGSVGDLLDHVTSQDNIVFTGSGDTGRKVRGHAQVVHHNVRVNIEADSLNASVVGPDVDLDSDTFQMFLSDVATDITQKAGQKCTAVRRILIPSGLVDEAIAHLDDRIGMAVVGDPAERATTVGPLATASQQRDILAGVAALEEVAGPPVIGGDASLPEQGYYVAPAVYRVEGGVEAPFVHEHEVFGPVATILPYSGEAAEAVAICAKGGGGLVVSMYSDDVDWARETVLGLAPWHGRVMWGSKKVHDQGVGPGTVLPSLVHGGPGQAGGGEELGGERGLAFYWQRTAVQGDRSLLDRIFGA